MPDNHDTLGSAAPAAVGGGLAVRPGQVGEAVSDEDLDAYILTRLTLLGVDLSVLPEDDEDAPADQRRILRSARRFLRGTPPDIHGFEMDPQVVAPVLYPSETSYRTRRGNGE